MRKEINVIGAGLAGSEAAWYLANNNINVNLYEMRPYTMTPAHKTDKFAELVCSNSFRSERMENAAGLLKFEMKKLNSLVMKAAEAKRIPAGGALAVDREGFANYITEKIKSHPNINIVNSEVVSLDLNDYNIIATGPLSSEGIIKSISSIIDENLLYFYDAASPIITKESIDNRKTFRASRYDHGDDYINCPMNKSQYFDFINELLNAETVLLKDFETKYFEGCMPIEVLASRGIDTLRFGPLKPVGLNNPDSSIKPYAVVQLRQDDHSGDLYNLVGFQTNLKFKEQKRVFSMIPGLNNSEFVRYGVMHRNTFINSPKLLNANFQLKSFPNLYFAGQITGVEGYIESAASGIVAAIHLNKLLQGIDMPAFPNSTAIGALSNYISFKSIKNFQPMNINFGIIKPLNRQERNKKKRYELIVERAKVDLEEHINKYKIVEI